MRGWNMRGQGPNAYPFCRCNPSLPSRRAMRGYCAEDMNIFSMNEAEHLKSTAEYLKGQLDAVNKRLKDIDKAE
ncbi:DUF5320 domain-containing protein [Lutispora saccharofermentans]|uniref:Uncharacterized protein n=1 Tax=Lutispora saccharofermentans TaxID=3024236 RepID=A0ABT1NBN8_9FIRM|nr:DUF5320 domain-containing protein [Lutispora saccharofermentans]MCQ1528675.1 hypothetical protein [Lutispora saccharofermentans]